MTACAALFTLLYGETLANPLQTLAITFGTIAYHFDMRLAVGGAFQLLMKNRADITKKWYRVSQRELRFYEFLRVKQWKKDMPTYRPDFFSPREHTWEEIAQAMCQAELVHEVIIPLSFLPLFGVIFWGALPVFLLTSLGAALLDASFVAMQRYNRPRVIRLAARNAAK